ncbi:hypothetical protein CEUSTIGMA_g10875.t1 [Chlamydomonas eustigma]|uniref:Ribosomal protein S19/S15 n=1 Tax=Chlamydomonas eustigma TaxID=1157962 RepID=A0A250XKY1_9CHLO|nr:hypothetical protein CEUSTIGMA_g10875.t1 [Chlamydomonas eustigma]|eukprot:GAX83450.1 hypothetical protein CEUSTIGMA_g10875.t1 [Chlamydomonas eustigma]
MPRSVWKGPYVAVNLLRDVIDLAKRHPAWWSQGRFQGVKAPEIINTDCRSSVILPDFLHCKFGVHNGKDYVPIDIKEAMIGHKLGEFSLTKKQPVHKTKDNSTGAKRINPKTEYLSFA